MGLELMFLAMLKPWLWALPFLLIAGFLKSPMFKGWLGEWRVRELIRRRLNPMVYREFHNVTIPSPLGDTTQIDHVYVSPFGILVIETKNMGHWIFGGRNQKTWTQQIYRTSVPFQNPLHQNYAHVKALQALLDLPEQVFKPIVVFVGDSTFKTPMPDEVCTYADLISYIHSIDTRILSDAEIDRVCRALHALRLEPSWQVHRQHIADLRRRHGEPFVRGSSAERLSAHDFIEAVGDRLMRVAEDRLRNGARRQVSRGLQVWLGVVAAKALFAIGIFVAMWWVLTTTLDRVQQASRQAPPVVDAPAASPLPVPQVARRSTPVTQMAAPTRYHAPTPAEVAESQRRADEAMRVLAPNTPEIPLTLPQAAQ